MTPTEQLKFISEKIIQLAQDRSCLQCLNFDKRKEICKLANQRPPAKVIVNGCSQHDFIPF